MRALIRWSEFALIALCIGISFWIFKAAQTGDLPRIVSEDGPLEFWHTLLCGAAAVVFLLAATTARGELITGSKVLGLFAVLAMLREAEWLGLAQPLDVIGLPNMTLEWLLYIVVAISMILIALIGYRDIPALIRLGFTWHTLPLTLTAAFYIAGWYVDRIDTDPGHHLRIWEELLETYGHAALLFSALHQHRIIADRADNNAGALAG